MRRQPKAQTLAPLAGNRGFESTSLQRRVSCEPRSREKLGRRCHDVDKRGQLKFRDSRRVFSPVSLRAGLVRLASAAVSALMCAAPAFSAALSTAR